MALLKSKAAIKEGRPHMKLNLKSTIAAPADNKSCQKALNGIIGNTRRGIVVDKTLDPDSNNPVANKPVSTALAALAGSSIPVVEGTEAELTDEERNTGITSKYTIPAAQTSPFILHSDDIGYILVDIFAYDESVAYCGITAIDRSNWALISGSDTTVYISDYQPVSLYPIQIDHFPDDETTSVDINFPLIDRIGSAGCLVGDIDVSKVFIKNGNDLWGSFQTPIIYDIDGKYKCWYIEGKEGDDTGKFATVKCKIINIGGPTPTITFED